MKINKTKLDNVLEIELEPYKDFRGYYLETYNKDLYNHNNIKVEFIQDDISVSKKNVLRGIHGDNETWKLVSCFYGEFYLIVVNNDPYSNQYKEWTSFILSENKNNQILIPPKFGNGHLVLSDRTIFNYKQSTYYNPQKQFTILWNDPDYNFDWPIKEPILSKRDTIGRFED
ncbi:MAG: dTDP-4-dehydrorhamnose 3,5-epimerase [Candidatus Marinimicrobia bacterium]|nr:dTDP-4-dehydrorhamnose 3,5-epimerase [Candidatus Neomarinimicrobiota bacterium]